MSNVRCHIVMPLPPEGHRSPETSGQINAGLQFPIAIMPPLGTFVYIDTHSKA